MSVLRAIAGVIVGFIVMVLCVQATTALLRLVTSHIGTASQSPILELLDFAYALIFMGVGAFIATLVGRRGAGLAFSAVLFVLSAPCSSMVPTDPAMTCASEGRYGQVSVRQTLYQRCPLLARPAQSLLE